MKTPALTNRQRSAWARDYYKRHYADTPDTLDSPAWSPAWSPQEILGHQPDTIHNPNLTMRPIELDQLLVHFENLSSDHHNLQHISEICSPASTPTI